MGDAETEGSLIGALSHSEPQLTFGDTASTSDAHLIAVERVNADRVVYVAGSPTGKIFCLEAIERPGNGDLAGRYWSSGPADSDDPCGADANWGTPAGNPIAKPVDGHHPLPDPPGSIGFDSGNGGGSGDDLPDELAAAFDIGPTTSYVAEENKTQLSAPYNPPPNTKALVVVVMRANRSIGGTLDDNAIDATLNGVSPNHTHDTVGGTGSSGRRRTIKLLTFYNPSPGTINVDIHKSNADVTFIPISIKNAGGAVTQHNLGSAGTAVLGNTASISAPPGAGKAFTQPAFFVAGAVRHCSGTGATMPDRQRAQCRLGRLPVRPEVTPLRRPTFLA